MSSTKRTMLKVIRDSMIKEHGQGLPTSLPGFTFTHICMQQKKWGERKSYPV